MPDRNNRNARPMIEMISIGRSSCTHPSTDGAEHHAEDDLEHDRGQPHPRREAEQDGAANPARTTMNSAANGRSGMALHL
jgi:hypothetical protein